MMPLEDRWSQTLEGLKAQGRFRSFALPKGIDLTSNDYLGYGNGRRVPGFQPQIDFSDLPRTGMASRLLRGHHAVWEQVEEELAKWHGSEAVLMMTSGFTANEGLISTICEPADWVAGDELNHACISEGLRLARSRRFAFKHNDLNHLEEGLKAESAKRTEGRELFIITESLFSMDGDRSKLREIADLAERFGAHLIVDEAHSTGCFGPKGSGCVDDAGIRSRVLASVHTGGKALGVPGAYICCSKLMKDYLINRCRHLIFTTALPAACGNWWLEMLPKVQADDEGRQSLRRAAMFFHTELLSHGVTAQGDSYIVPVVLGDDPRAVQAARNLQAQGYDIRAIRPPSVPPGTSRLRVSIHADHDIEMLRKLAEAIGASVK